MSCVPLFSIAGSILRPGPAFTKIYGQYENCNLAQNMSPTLRSKWSQGSDLFPFFMAFILHFTWPAAKTNWALIA